MDPPPETAEDDVLVAYQNQNFYCNNALFPIENIVRYWIWWNDLIQGPFEPDELTSLKSFSEDLLVCMEDRQEWIPASRVADLSAAIELLRARQAAPRVPPPPPPKGPPNLTPLQGEFFPDPPGQESLLDSEDSPKGPFAYRPVSIDSDLPVWAHLRGQATMPFHFAQQPASVAVIELPQAKPQQRPAPEIRPVPQARPERVQMTPPPVIRESPVRKLEEEAPIPLSVLDTAVPILDEPYTEEQKPQWLIWMVGVLFALGVMGSLGYWFVDRANTRSAIAEANRIEPTKPLPIPETKLPAWSDVEPAPVARVVPVKAPSVLSRLSSSARHTLSHKQHPQTAHVQAVQKIPKAPVQVVAPDSEPAVDVPSAPPAPAAAMPGIGTVSSIEDQAQVPLSKPDPWKGKQNEAILLVQNKTLPKSKITIGNQARAILQEMHEKELIHAAETGERLYLPDKMAWAALQEEGSHYLVYLNFLSWQASGERVQSRSYQFQSDVAKKEVHTEDPAAQQDLLGQPAELTFKHNPMATDIESILGGVDTYNKHKVQLIIVKKNNRNREERKKIEAALATAQGKVTRAVVYFRRTYTEKALENVAKAYAFSELLKG